MNVWSIIKYKGENYIILMHNSNKTTSITRFEPLYKDGDIIAEDILLQIDKYYEDVINFEINSNIPVMNIKTNMIKDVIFEWE